jgi:hypothetical protein
MGPPSGFAIAAHPARHAVKASGLTTARGVQAAIQGALLPLAI